MQDSSNTSSRRELLKGALAAGVVAGVSPILHAAEELSSTVTDRVPGKAKAIALPQPDLIRGENAKPGTTDWLLTNTHSRSEVEVSLPVDRRILFAHQPAGRRETVDHG